MGKSDSASTKDLRLALRRYRSSFDGCYRFKLADSGTIRCSWNLNYPSSRLSCGDVRQRTEIVMAKAVMKKRADKKAKKAKSVSETGVRCSSLQNAVRASRSSLPGSPVRFA